MQLFGFDLSHWLLILAAFLAQFGITIPGFEPPPPPDRSAPTVQISPARLPLQMFDRDETLLRLSGVDITATDNVGVTGVTVELLRFPTASSNTPNGFFNFTTRTFVNAPSPQTQTQATPTANRNIFHVNGALFPQLAVNHFYGVRARARDAAGNSRTALRRFTRRAGFSAQSTRITGRVVTSNGAPVVGVGVRSNATTGEALTDANGRYELVNVTRTGNVVVTPDPTDGTFNPTSRTVVVTSLNQGEIPAVNFIRTGPPAPAPSFRPGAYRIDFVLTGPPSAQGSLVIVADANGVVAPIIIAQPNGQAGSLQGTISANGQLALTITDIDGAPDQLNATLAVQNGIIRGSGQIVDTDAPGGPAVRGTFNATKLESGGPGANPFRPATYTVNFSVATVNGRFNIFVDSTGNATPTVVPFPDGSVRTISGTVSSTGQANFIASDPNGLPDQINVALVNQNGVVSGSGQIVDTDPGPLEPPVLGTVSVVKGA